MQQQRGTSSVLVVAHLLEPHPPALRTADCKVRLVDPFGNPGWVSDDYAGSVECFNRRLIEAVDRIVAEDPDSVLVVHSDHGRTSSVSTTQTGVLSALGLPAECPIPVRLSGVNVMRVVEACLSSKEPELLDDVAFWGGQLPAADSRGAI